MVQYTSLAGSNESNGNVCNWHINIYTFMIIIFWMSKVSVLNLLIRHFTTIVANILLVLFAYTA